MSILTHIAVCTLEPNVAMEVLAPADLAQCEKGAVLLHSMKDRDKGW